VLGNHDYSLNQKDDPKNERVAALVAESLERVGIPVLHNEAISLSPRGQAAADGSVLYLVGIGSEWAHEARPEVALAGVPEGAPRIVFMHNPSSFPEIPAGAAPLAVAAHTHGGQIRIPGTPSWSWLDIVAQGEAHADGWIEPSYGQPGNRLYVNRGIGFSAVPVRINAPPEITYFRLLGEAAPTGAGSR
jgi:predicted MPP superfamily phosphohydrolase